MLFYGYCVLPVYFVFCGPTIKRTTTTTRGPSCFEKPVIGFEGPRSYKTFFFRARYTRCWRNYVFAMRPFFFWRHTKKFWRNFYICAMLKRFFFFFLRHTKKFWRNYVCAMSRPFFTELNFGTGERRIISLPQGPDFLSTALTVQCAH